GSSTIITRLFAASGIPAICSGGLIFSPSQVYLAGIKSPSAKAVLVMVRRSVMAVVAVTAIAGPIHWLLLKITRNLEISLAGWDDPVLNGMPLLRTDPIQLFQR